MGVASTLGQPVRRREDARLLAGRGRFLDDLPYADVATIVGCSEDAARQNVHAALKTLRRELSR